MKVLSIDTATECASCALLDGNKLLGEINFNYKKQHSVILMDMIDILLKNTNCDITELEGFVVSKGPGSFTGLRIGMSIVKGLSQGTDKPLVGISTLDALAYNMCYTKGIICPILDALRNNVYTALYTYENSELKKLTDYMVISIDELIMKINEYNKPICFIGDAIPLFKDKLVSEIRDICFAPTHLNIAKASALGDLGINMLSSGAYDNIYDLAPIYLRKSQAEREYEKRMGTNNNG